MQYIEFVRSRFCFVALLFAAAIPDGFTSDQLLQPFAISNLNPFIGVYGLAPMQSPVVAAPGRNAVNIALDAASHFTNGQTQSESIRIDGESYRLALRFSRGLPGQWETGIEVPVVSHRGGFMDGFINQWHDTFNLPTLGRDLVANDQLVFDYSRADRNLVSVRSSSTGLGDVLLFAGTTVKNTADTAVTLRAQLKLPSGDADRLLGSGATDLALSALLARQWGSGWAGVIRLGGAYLGTGDVLPELQKNWVGFGSAFLGWRPFQSLAFKLQLDAHTAVYQNSDIDQLTDDAYILTIGGSVKLGRSTYLDVGVSEDELNPNISPDVGFHLRLRTLH